MAYKTILTVVTPPQSDDEQKVVARQLAASVAVARREDAHLEVLALGVDRTQIGYFYAGASAMMYQETLDRAQEEAREVEAEIRKTLGREEIRWSVDTAVAQIGGLAGLIAQSARFADLVVLPQPYGPARGTEAEAVIDAATGANP